MTQIHTEADVKAFQDAQGTNIEAVARAAELVLNAYEEKYAERGPLAPGGARKLSDVDKAGRQAVQEQVFADPARNPEGIPRETHTDLRLLNNTLDAIGQGVEPNSQDILTINFGGANLAYAKGLLQRAQDFTEVPGLFSNTRVQSAIQAGLQAFEGANGLDAATAKLPGATAENPFQGVADHITPVVGKDLGSFTRRALDEAAKKGQSEGRAGGS